MTLRHYEPVAADCPRFSPGWSLGTGIPEDVDCSECLATLESEGRWAGCDHDELCGCYGEGYAAGRGKAFFEMEVWEPKDHDPSCGCSCCRTAQEVLLKMLAHSCRVEPDELLELRRQFDVGTWLNLLAQRYERKA